MVQGMDPPLLLAARCCRSVEVRRSSRVGVGVCMSGAGGRGWVGSSCGRLGKSSRKDSGVGVDSSVSSSETTSPVINATCLRLFLPSLSFLMDLLTASVASTASLYIASLAASGLIDGLGSFGAGLDRLRAPRLGYLDPGGRPAFVIEGDTNIKEASAGGE